MFLKFWTMKSCMFSQLEAYEKIMMSIKWSCTHAHTHDDYHNSLLMHAWISKLFAFLIIGSTFKTYNIKPTRFSIQTCSLS